MNRPMVGMALAALWLACALNSPEAVACAPQLSACGYISHPALVQSRASDGVLPSAVTTSVVVASLCFPGSRIIAFDPFATTNLPEPVGYELSAKGPLPAGVILPTTPTILGDNLLRLAYTGTEPSLSFTLSIVAVEVDGDRGPSRDVQIDVTFPTDARVCPDQGCSAASPVAAHYAWMLAVLAILAFRRRRLT